MISIRHIREDDKEFWFRLDKHLSEVEFLRGPKMRCMYERSDVS